MDCADAHRKLMAVTGGQPAATFRRDDAERNPVRWAGSEPVEANSRHDGCECLLCCPPCAVTDCWSSDVTARLVPVPAGTARVLLCIEHGGMYPIEGERHG